MGKRFRQRRNGTINDVTGKDDVVANHETYSTDIQYQFEGYSSSNHGLDWDSSFPGPREIRVTQTTDSYFPAYAGVGSIRDDSVSGPNREVGGRAGEVGDLPYSLGVVDSNTVENFELTGQQAIIRRMPNPGGNTGPVGTSDHNMMLALAYEQQVNQYYPNEASQADLIRSV